MAAAPCAACGRARRRRIAKSPISPGSSDVQGDDELDAGAARRARPASARRGAWSSKARAASVAPVLPRSAIMPWPPASTSCRSITMPIVLCWPSSRVWRWPRKEKCHGRAELRASWFVRRAADAVPLRDRRLSGARGALPSPDRPRHGRARALRHDRRGAAA